MCLNLLIETTCPGSQAFPGRVGSTRGVFISWFWGFCFEFFSDGGLAQPAEWFLGRRRYMINACGFGLFVEWTFSIVLRASVS